MTDKPDYRMYLEEKFEGMIKLIDAQFYNMHDKLEAIEKQTTKTNSRVNKLEDKMECVEKDLEEYHFVKKYPKLIVGAVAVMVVIALFTFYGMTKSVNNKVIETKESLKNEIRLMDGVSKVTRGGYVKYNDRGMSDSIKVR